MADQFIRGLQHYLKPALGDFTWGKLLKTVLNTFILTLALIGAAHVLDMAMGDGSLPRLYNLREKAPHLAPRLMDNSTRSYTYSKVTPQQCWEGLQSTLKILRVIAPEIAAWLEQLHRENRIDYELLPLQKVIFRDRNILCSYNGNWGVLNIGQSFWSLPDGEKAAYLVHEYRHYRQNRAKVIAALASKLISGKFMEYGSTLEDEAYLYQLEAYRAMGLAPYSILHYLYQRSLLHFHEH